MKTFGGSGDIALYGNGQFHASAALPQRKERPVYIE
jgi:hypothetical protein